MTGAPVLGPAVAAACRSSRSVWRRCEVQSFVTALSASSTALARPSGAGDRHHRGVVLGVASVASFMVALDLLVVTTSLDVVRRDLAVSTSDLQWTVTAYGVSFAALLMTGAALGDRFGRRRMLVAGLLVFAVGSIGAALSTGLGSLVVARVVQGIGGAIILPVGLTIVATAFPPARRGSAIGILEGVTGLAVIAGPLVGGAVAQWLPWQWIFWINVPIALVAIPVVLAVVEESFGPDGRVDVVGLALVSTAATAIVWGLSRGNDVGWASKEIVAVVVVGVVAGAGFAAWERHVTAPMLPPRLFRSRAFVIGVTTAFLVAGSLYIAVYFMAQYIQGVMRYDSFATGLRLLPWTATLLVVAPLAGALADRVGHRRVLSSGLALQALGMAWIALTAHGGGSYAAMVGPLIVTGIGTSVALPVTQAAIVGAVAESDIGKAAGTNNMLQELGGVFGIAIGAAVFSASVGTDTAPDLTDGFVAAIAIAAVLAACACVVSLTLPRPGRT